MNHSCPICAYPGLEEPPRSPSGGGSYEICPCCGFQFGVTDDDDGVSCDTWRLHWAEEGMQWFSRGVPAPAGWDARAQFAKVSSKTSSPPAPKLAPKPAKPSPTADGPGPRRPR